MGYELKKKKSSSKRRGGVVYLPDELHKRALLYTSSIKDFDKYCLLDTERKEACLKLRNSDTDVIEHLKKLHKQNLLKITTLQEFDNYTDTRLDYTSLISDVLSEEELLHHRAKLQLLDTDNEKQFFKEFMKMPPEWHKKLKADGDLEFHSKRLLNSTFEYTSELRSALTTWMTHGDPLTEYMPIAKWDVSQLTDMSRLFSDFIETTGFNAEPLVSFNENINDWNVSNVTNMSEMFSHAEKFNQPLDKWNVSNVTDMSGMFKGASDFNQPLDTWDVSNVEYMDQMFYNASNFNQPLDTWDVSNVTDMSKMFYKASSFDQDIKDWKVPKMKNMNNIFTGATAFQWRLKNIK